MIALVMYEFKYLNTGEIIPEKYFMNSYIDKVYESEQAYTSAKRLRKILNFK